MPLSMFRALLRTLGERRRQRQQTNVNTEGNGKQFFIENLYSYSRSVQ